MADDHANSATSLASLQPPDEPTERETAAGIVPSHGISINLPTPAGEGEGEDGHHFRHPVRHV